MNFPYWFELAIISTVFAIGNLFLGHFEVGVPKWKRLLKLVLLWCLGITISHYAGRFWFFGMLFGFALAAAVIHFWYLPRHGVDPLTGEPKEKYYRLRGWTHLLEKNHE